MQSGVFPTCVGVFLWKNVALCNFVCLPHVRGGVSGETYKLDITYRSSPRAWGCFSVFLGVVEINEVFPTCVGVFLSGLRTPAMTWWSSPRAWGCFSEGGWNGRDPDVFPTCVGVFPILANACKPTPSLPHVRGGVSYSFVYCRCLKSLPHVRGGVSVLMMSL